MPTTVQFGIEDILLTQGLLTQDQVLALKQQSITTNLPTETLLVKSNLVPLAKLFTAKSQVLGVPFIKLENKAIPVDVLNTVPENVAKRYHVLPFDKKGNQLFLAMVDPLDLQVIQFLEKRNNLTIKPYLALPEEIEKAISEQYTQTLSSEVSSALKEVSALQNTEQEIEDKAEVIREAPVANIAAQLLEYAVKSKASDIHIEPEDDRTRVRYRIDGILHEKVILPRGVHESLISRMKIMSSLKIEEKRLPQDGRFSYTSGKSVYDLRISTIPTIYGEKIVMRLLPKSTQPPTLQDLGLRGISLKNLQAQILRPHGIILVCGPTGSGKTTTLYSILTKISSTKVNILTIEDPVEYQIPGANQVQVNAAIGLTFANALRSFLRQDPNIMLVGEIRDAETADLAIQAALTGHEVFSTLHTTTASGALPRLLDMGVEPFLLASSINAVVGQRILRKICQHCRTPITPPTEVASNIQAILGSLLPTGKPVTLFKGAGCNECGNTGYSGRVGIYEVLVLSPGIMKLVLSKSSAADVEKMAVTEGMITLKQDGYLKVIEGITTLEEVLRVAED
ncbi:hypothetical protein A3C32_01430 [Candidatus Daviesbacteria bacterium RIFCSPHIGHO2_02_FULL_41_14]|uniref:AAA+ ATPase domain-containing protein n=1 Tax=Candidatus Daviesbacteria bacterium RIFCSPLOWO2_01_FULL_40_24 TaxID=1797787 RepID=A0A1F5MJX2_9BACT|nr:MAG: hypothetical protein A2780_00940 [Candidatus Daviesbacteria bacterium RIFCSPHIGHO2_01_FULL_41_45]OGE34053.1 MAG: hypothetical protein A3C32_01430 [Candidatus Daviesbacteria bacterium RIFCSPHIGHO2_02_FULL_41_14]OGE65648.1 MAG: hypothetical protein A3B49_00200 [Candidatus Daviesbacteria bacterium RIFCSPLOWO2_01_FULL_40_24]